MSPGETDQKRDRDSHPTICVMSSLIYCKLPYRFIKKGLNTFLLHYQTKEYVLWATLTLTFLNPSLKLCQILKSVSLGMDIHQLYLLLPINALTVKNHV